jgi:hypothetical protein
MNKFLGITKNFYIQNNKFFQKLLSFQNFIDLSFLNSDLKNFLENYVSYIYRNPGDPGVITFVLGILIFLFKKFLILFPDIR